MRFLIRLLINAAALWVASLLLGPERIQVPSLAFTNGLIGLLLVALVFGLLNAFIRPILALVTCPLQLLTLGLFTFVLNAIMLLLTSSVSDYFGWGFHVYGFVAALLGSIIVSIVSIVLSLFVREPKQRR